MAMNFPTPTQVGEVYTDANGNTYVCTVLGPPAQWVGSGSSTDLNATYLRKDASNDPVTGQLVITPASDTTGLVVNQTSGNTTAAMRITNEGSGNSFVVEDSANPDSTPVVIDASGILVAGSTTPRTDWTNNTGVAPVIQGGSASGVGATSIGLNRQGGGPCLFLGNSGANGTGVVASGNSLGFVIFEGNDGTYLQRAAVIESEVDGTVTSGNVPARLVFSTTPVGASPGPNAPVERIRITNGGATRLARNTINLSGLYFVGNNTFQTLTAWSDVGNQEGGGSFLAMVSNHVSTTGGKNGLYRVYINYNGTLGAVTTISADAGLSFNLQVSGGNLQAQAFDSGVGLSTSMRVSFIFNDQRVHIY